jgi:hypothetical protein
VTTMMNEPQCKYRTVAGEKRHCRIVAALTNLPLVLSETNDDACLYCLSCGIAPDLPNEVTASMSIHAARRAGDGMEMMRRMGPHLAGYSRDTAEPDSRCVLRGVQTRQVACKPCQAGGLTPVLIAVFHCPEHGECTLKNTGAFPRIHACVTCDDRVSEYPKLRILPTSEAVVDATGKSI